MSHNLYQLRSKRKYATGEEFVINGPYDKKGRVITCIHKPTDKPEHKGREYFNLVRGTGTTSNTPREGIAMITQDKIQHYIDELENESPVVSTSHITLRNLYDRYGYTQVDDAIDRYWFNKREEL